MTLEKEDTLKKDTRHGSTNEGRYMFRLIFVNFVIFFSLGWNHDPRLFTYFANHG